MRSRPDPAGMLVPMARRRAMGMASSLLSAGAALVDLVLPGECAGCASHVDRAGALLCRACRLELDGPARRAWPTPVPAGLPPPWAVADYDGAARGAILAHKEEGRFGLAGPLGDALARAVTAGLAATPASRTACVGLVPVPSRRTAVRVRGQDATLRLTRRAAATARRAGSDVEVLPVVRIVRGMADQAGLDARERAANLQGALAVPDRLARHVRGRTVLVVDDVITTGASIEETARALREAGADVACAAVVAATRRRRPPGLCL